MVQGIGWTKAGSSVQDHEITFVIAPPAEVRPKSRFPLPVIVAVCSNRRSSRDPDQQLVAHASLRDETGSTAAPGLTGTLTSSVRGRFGNMASGYGRFDPLIVAQPGRYRLRIMLGVASGGGVVTTNCVDSDIITVHTEASVQRPSTYYSFHGFIVLYYGRALMVGGTLAPGQISKLWRLIDENIDIQPEDIESWERLSQDSVYSAV
ncbi:hypothetical protein BDV59DRAFT_173521 [Aspergillus ambiguus]|uniref:uncharacterized protein n=1 Tax=Aspergillus ambiguus TaxID=176160 RepID=UPI003CCDC6FA